MKIKKILFCSMIALVPATVLGVYFMKKIFNDYSDQRVRLATHIKTPGDVKKLFSLTVEDIQTKTADYLKEAQQAIDELIKIKAEDRTLENTVRAFDTIVATSNFAIFYPILYSLKQVSPDESIRNAAYESIVRMDEFSVDHISNNVQLYKAFQEYVDGNAHTEHLTVDQQYFLDKIMADFKRSGLELPANKREHVAKLSKELAQLSQDFSANIANDASTITVSEVDLKGLEPSFVQSLKRTDAGLYILGVDAPTYNNVIENCAVESTRKALWQAFNNRAYPTNHGILSEIIAKRDELAKLVGFESYAHLDLDNQMVSNPERAQQFLTDLLTKASAKEQQEFDLLIADLPDTVSLTAEGKINPWNFAYSKALYKKKHHALDERVIAQYFPMEKTIEGLLDIYRQFLSVDFKQLAADGFWHEDVRLIEVLTHDGRCLGYLALDLYPRANKYSHACHITITPAMQGSTAPCVGLVIANFPKPTADVPSLLLRSDVKTFFHEFGHALHALFGKTEFASLSGTSTKLDFVELPSQMLEEWLYDAEILKNLSSHYQTGEHLSDELIATIQQAKNLDSGTFVQTQILYAFLSLELFKAGADKDVQAILKNLSTQIRKNLVFNDANHFYAAFGHLTGYGARYYGYLWSKVFALDNLTENPDKIHQKSTFLALPEREQ